MRGLNVLQALFAMQWMTSRDKSSSHEGEIYSDLPLRILTHNIRYATLSPGKNEKPWEDRLPLIVNELSYNTRHLDGRDAQYGAASFICMQEVLHGQLHDILSALNHGNDSGYVTDLPDGPYWAHIGVGREDGKTKGEYSPILYPTNVFDLLHFENTWLSETPNRPSKGWDAGSERILITGVFEHKATKRRLAAFNTHLDNEGSEARKQSVAVIVDVVDRIRKEWSPKDAGGGLAFFLAGDFNSFPSQEAYKAVLKSNMVQDAHELVLPAARYGDEITFTGFQPDTDMDKDEIGRIDYVWFGPKRLEKGDVVESQESSESWRIQGYSVLPNVFDSGVFASDHRCVIADAVLEV